MEKAPLDYVESPVSLKSLDTFSDIDRTKLRRKIDFRILPLFTLLFLLSFLDRGNIGNAKIEGLAEDLNLQGNQYNLCLTIFFIFYATMEIPSNAILKRSRPDIFVPATVTLFAVVMTLMGTVQNYAQLMATRALLGFFEAALFPGISYILSMYYRKNELLFRQAIFVSAASIAGAFSGLLAAAISNMDGVGGYAGWRWIFILEGLLTFVCGVLSFWWFPKYPKDASFLTEREREFVLWNVHHLTNQDKVHPDAPKGEDTSSDKRYFFAVLKDINCWCQMFSYLGVALPTYGISLFLPTIVKNLGYTSVKSQLLTVPIYVVSCVWSIIQGYLSDRSGLRSPFLSFNYLCMIAGFIACICLDPRTNAHGIYAAMYIVGLGMYPAIPLSIVWNANNLSGSYKRAIGIGFQIGLANYGGAFVSNFYRNQDSPRFILGHALTLGFVCLGAAAMVIVVFNYVRTNRKDEIALKDGEYENYSDEELLKMGDKSPYFSYRL